VKAKSLLYPKPGTSPPSTPFRTLVKVGIPELAGREAVFGISANNNPTVNDVWNSTPAWGYPISLPSWRQVRAL